MTLPSDIHAHAMKLTAAVLVSAAFAAPLQAKTTILLDKSVGSDDPSGIITAVIEDFDTNIISLNLTNTFSGSDTVTGIGFLLSSPVPSITSIVSSNSKFTEEPSSDPLFGSNYDCAVNTGSFFCNSAVTDQNPTVSQDTSLPSLDEFSVVLELPPPPGNILPTPFPRMTTLLFS